MNEKRRDALDHLFKPRSIAILGASADLKKVSGRPLAYMLRFGYPGAIYPINPKYASIAGIRCYPSLNDVPGEIDTLMVIIPAQEILDNLQLALEKEVKVAVIISGGFAETGPEGKKLQDRLSAFARETGMLIYGPNTTGFLSLVNRTVATFSQSLEVVDRMTPGETGLITQSGAFGAAIFVRAMRVGLGLSHWAATGNEADLEFCDFLEYMVEDPHTRVIAGFLAGVEDGRRFASALEDAARCGKPVVLLKVGDTESGKRAALSHTGAMVGSSRAYEAVFAQKGVVVARDIAQLIDFCLAFTKTPLPKGKRVGIMTESGGGGVLLTERCSELELEVSEIKGATRDRLKEVVPALGSVANPVDLTGQSLSRPELIKSALEVMLEADDFDIVVPLLLMSQTTGEQKARDLVELIRGLEDRKSVVVCWPEGPRQWIRYLMENGIYVSVTPTRCAMTIKALAGYAQFLTEYKAAIGTEDIRMAELPPDRKHRALKVIEEARRRLLSEYEAMKILEAYGIPVPKASLAGSAQEALDAASSMGYPVVAKLSSPDIPHKSEAGLVRLNIDSDERLLHAFDDLINQGRRIRPDALIQGILIQEMVTGRGVETIVGYCRERPFGPTVLFGLGGIFVEILEDVSAGVVPLRRRDALNMIRNSRGYKVLLGARGGRRCDIHALCTILMNVSMLAQELEEEIEQMDINPLLVLEDGKGVKALDALMVLRRREKGT